jgi:hypothetical protein
VLARIRGPSWARWGIHVCVFRSRRSMLFVVRVGGAQVQSGKGKRKEREGKGLGC